MKEQRMKGQRRQRPALHRGPESSTKPVQRATNADLNSGTGPTLNVGF